MNRDNTVTASSCDRQTLIELEILADICEYIEETTDNRKTLVPDESIVTVDLCDMEEAA